MKVISYCFPYLTETEQWLFPFQMKTEILTVLKHVREIEGKHLSVSDFRHISAQTVFSVLDHLTRFLRHRVSYLSIMAQHAAATSRSRNAAAGTWTIGRLKTWPWMTMLIKSINLLGNKIILKNVLQCWVFDGIGPSGGFTEFSNAPMIGKSRPLVF